MANSKSPARRNPARKARSKSPGRKRSTAPKEKHYFVVYRYDASHPNHLGKELGTAHTSTPGAAAKKFAFRDGKGGKIKGNSAKVVTVKRARGNAPRKSRAYTISKSMVPATAAYKKLAQERGYKDTTKMEVKKITKVDILDPVVVKRGRSRSRSPARK
jgi:hypothetical protein